MAIEDIKEIVREEKEQEQRLQAARTEALKTIEAAEKEAKRIIAEESESDSYYQRIRDEQARITEGKKARLIQDYDEQIEEVTKTAKRNMEKTVDFIIKQVFKE